MQRDWHKDENTSVCRGCGLVLPIYAGPTHAFMGASPACWRLYGQASTLSWGHRDGLPLLRLVVNAYGAQHPGVEQVRALQSVAVHLMGLCTILERGVHTEPRLMHVRERDASPRPAPWTCTGWSRRARTARSPFAAPWRRRARTSTPPPSKPGHATCGRPGSPTTRRCGAGWIRSRRATA